MKTIVTIFSLLVLVLHTAIATGQGLFIDTAKQNLINTGIPGATSEFITGADSFEWYGLEEEYEESNKFQYGTPVIGKFRVDSISNYQFLNYVKKSKYSIDTTSTKVTRTDSSFCILTGGGNVIFKQGSNDFEPYRYYDGFLIALNLHMVSTVDGHNEIAWTSLVDSKTGKIYDFPSGSDYGTEYISISPGNLYLVGISNDQYESNSHFHVFKIDTFKKDFTLTPYYGLSIRNGYVENFAWVDNKTFAVQISEAETTSLNQETKTSYLKIAIEK